MCHNEHEEINSSNVPLEICVLPSSPRARAETHACRPVFWTIHSKDSVTVLSPFMWMFVNLVNCLTCNPMQHGCCWHIIYITLWCLVNNWLSISGYRPAQRFKTIAEGADGWSWEPELFEVFAWSAIAIWSMQNQMVLKLELEDGTWRKQIQTITNFLTLTDLNLCKHIGMINYQQQWLTTKQTLL